MYKPLVIFNNSLKPRPGLKSLKREGWDIYNILSRYDSITLKAFAEEAERMGSDKLGVIVENINDPIIEDIYESAGKTKVEILDINRLYEADAAGSAAPATSTSSTPSGNQPANQSSAGQPADSQSEDSSLQKDHSDIIKTTKNHISFCFVIHMQQYTNLDKIKQLFNTLGKKTASNGILDQIQRENHNVDWNKGGLGPIVNAIGTMQYTGKGKDRISYVIKAAKTGKLAAWLIDANTRRETSLIDPTILTIQQSEYMAQGLTNDAYIDMVNAYCGPGTIAGVTSGNNSLISDLILDSSSSFSISDNPINKVSRKREAFITFMYFSDPSSVLHVNYSPEDAQEELVYYFNKNTTTDGLRQIAAYIENTCKAHGFAIDPEATIKANNERVKQIVYKIKEEIAAGHKVHAYFDPTKNIKATAIWNASGVFATKCVWLNNIGYGSKMPKSDEEAADEADEEERQRRINKIKSGGLIHDWAQAWGKFSDGYQALADATAGESYSDKVAEEEYYADLAKGQFGKTKIDNKLTMSFVCAPSFDDFATIMFPTWPMVKQSGVYSDVDPVRKNSQAEKQSEPQPADKSQPKPESSANKQPSENEQSSENKQTSGDERAATGSENKNGEKTSSKPSDDSLFPTKNKDEGESLFKK